MDAKTACDDRLQLAGSVADIGDIFKNLIEADIDSERQCLIITRQRHHHSQTAARAALVRSMDDRLIGIESRRGGPRVWPPSFVRRKRPYSAHLHQRRAGRPHQHWPRE
jgi:hypothetical protein